ncbi:hypothetical protein B0H12DRAFT_707227 [Mycena haematopus]|nr:hypothetical protein B0H12DRAFT_707227 [Mycena haematopus]
MDHIQNHNNGSIPEHEHEHAEDSAVERYIIDLGSGATESACTTPPVQVRTHRPFRPLRQAAKSNSAPRQKEAQRECGICFELAVSPVRTRCCAHLFCAEHIGAWLHGPASDGRCPACRAPVRDPSASTWTIGQGLLALGHPALAALQQVLPLTPPPSRSNSPSPMALTFPFLLLAHRHRPPDRTHLTHVRPSRTRLYHLARLRTQPWLQRERKKTKT